MWTNRKSQKKKIKVYLNLIRSHVSIMTTATVIIISLIRNIKIAIIVIEITKNGYHKNNNSNNNGNNNNNKNNNDNNDNNNKKVKIILRIKNSVDRLNRCYKLMYCVWLK